MKYIFLLKYPVIRLDTGYPVLEISRISGIRPTGPSLIIITCVSRGKSFRFIGQAKVNDTLKIKRNTSITASILPKFIKPFRQTNIEYLCCLIENWNR